MPIMKKGEGRTVEEYRGVTLMSALYKAYTIVLAERLKEEMTKNVIPQNQTGFKESMEMIDNICDHPYGEQADGKERWGNGSLFHRSESGI